MRVLTITPMYPSQANPAYGVFVRRQVEALRELGVDVLVASTSVSTPRYRLATKSVELVWHTLQGVRRGFDVVHVHFPTIAGMCGLLAAWVRRAPLVVTLHGGEVDEMYLRELRPWKAWLTNRMALRSALGADAVIAVASAVADSIVRDGVPESKIRVFDMGVDCRLFRPRPREEVRRELGMRAGAPLVVFAGWLIPIKGPEYFIRAAALFNGDPGCRWCLIGGGRSDELRSLADGLGIAERVMFIGQRPPDEVALWLAAADVMVMPSLTEPFGLAGLEALACGTPIVASDVGGLRSFVSDGVNGYLVAPRRPEAIASRLQNLLADAELREKMGKNGVLMAQQHDIRVQARKVLDIYERVTQRAVRDA